MPDTNSVLLKSETLCSLLGENYKLSIPDYQRIYCWEEKNVMKLLDDIKDFSHKPHHLGSVILHKTKNEKGENIVDGQQRLVTLSLLLLSIDADFDTSLLNEKFESKEAQDYISYNKYLIENYLKSNNLAGFKDNILKNLTFSVLMIQDSSLDLAYTFFSNQNSRGKKLSDYDLLKAHHLRYVYIPEQAEHLAERWDTLVLNSGNDASDMYLSKTLGLYLFRLRKWMRKKEWSNDEQYKVKTEFEAAAIIKNIPPFGEQFNFYESIQGGAHFFGYAEHFIHQYKAFELTQEFYSLKKLNGENHGAYREVIEVMLFAYYLKFGTLYLTDALIGIIRIISNDRYENTRFNLKRLLKFGGDCEITMMIDQSTSPTFFLAEMSNFIKKLSIRDELKPVQQRYKKHIQDIEKELESNIIIFSSTKN